MRFFSRLYTCAFPRKYRGLFSALTRVAVPIFFIITGYFYSDTIARHEEAHQIKKIILLVIEASNRGKHPILYLEHHAQYFQGRQHSIVYPVDFYWKEYIEVFIPK